VGKSWVTKGGGGGLGKKNQDVRERRPKFRGVRQTKKACKEETFQDIEKASAKRGGGRNSGRSLKKKSVRQGTCRRESGGEKNTFLNG